MFNPVSHFVFFVFAFSISILLVTDHCLVGTISKASASILTTPFNISRQHFKCMETSPGQ